MIKEIRVPDFGTTRDEMQVVEWLAKEGDKIRRGDVLLKLETDKTMTELESFASGYLKKIIAPEGTEVLAGDVIAYIGDESDQV